MQIIGDLVGLNAVARRLDVIDGQVEIPHGYLAQRLGKGLSSTWEEVFPERQASAHHIFPQARLRFVQPQRNDRAQGSPLVGGVEALLIEAMAGLVQKGEK